MLIKWIESDHFASGKEALDHFNWLLGQEKKLSYVQQVSWNLKADLVSVAAFIVVED